MLRFDGLLEVETVQIDHHPVWLAKYGQQIPVLLDAAGAFVCAIEPDPDAIADALR